LVSLGLGFAGDGVAWAGHFVSDWVSDWEVLLTGELLAARLAADSFRGVRVAFKRRELWAFKRRKLWAFHRRILWATGEILGRIQKGIVELVSETLNILA
jgi:hypothetical protein